MYRAVAVAVLSVFTVLAPRAAADGTVEQEFLSPAGQRVTFFPSPAPADLATIGPSGSRVAVYRNGEHGPKFDDIITTAARQDGGGGIALVFSPDGKRLAYAGRKRGEFVLMVDGEEVARGPYDRSANTIAGLGFTPDSQHYFYRVAEQNDQGQSVWHFVMDGDPSPAMAGDMQVVVSPVGDGYALFGTLLESQQQVFIRNGEVSDQQPSRIMYRADGKLYTLERRDSNDVVLKLEGETVFQGSCLLRDILLPDAGDSWALLCSAPQGIKPVCIVNGEPIEGELTATGSEDPFTFSPDASRWAAVVEPQRGRQYVVVDGQRQDEYQLISALSFSPDSSRLSYWGNSPTGWYFVLDGEEMDGVSSIAAPALYGGGGEHVAWHTFQINTGKRMVYLDGQSHELNHQFQHTTLGFSPDGARLAFMVGNTVMEFTADGVTAYDNLRVVAGGNNPRGGFRLMPNGYLYSPDSAYLTFVGTNVAARQNGIYLNGKKTLDTTGQAVVRLDYSPDGEHLFALVGRQHDRTVYVDGKPVYECAYSPFEQEESMWHVDDAGTLHFIVVDEEGIKRVSIAPSDDTSVADLLSD